MERKKAVKATDRKNGSTQGLKAEQKTGQGWKSGPEAGRIWKSDLGTGIGYLVLAAALSCFYPLSIRASDYIGSVKVKFVLDEVSESGQPLMEGETNSTKYSIDEVLTLEEYMEQWKDNDDADDDGNDRKDNSDLLALNATYLSMKNYSEVVYAAVVDSDGEQIFSSDRAKVSVSGLGASCIRLERLNDKSTMVLFVKFADLDSLAGEIETAGWTENGYGSWSQTVGTSAAWYEMRLYADGKLKGGTKITAGTSYDFRPLMQKAGFYRYQVRAVSASGDTGEWKESESLTVTAEMAAAYKEMFALDMQTNSDGSAPPSQVTYLNLGWQEMETGRYRYRESDCSYPQANWRKEDESWYYFDGDGYLVTLQYITWGNERYYVNESGRMLTEGKAPDGQEVQTDGRLKWPDI
ncbi:MAG: hypothetical protein PHV18_05755 [Lachnospiraceae bacterium]|nr:hypothetical protein [Lachnospiraceae bacterium]